MVWYRNANIKKRHWNQIRVLPRNTSEFLLLDLKLRQIYELTIVAENELGLGSFSSIMSIQLNDTEDASIGYLHQSNETTVRRPSSPVNLRLSHSGSNLYITWNHPMIMDSSTTIVYYVIQWRSTIHFNNQQSQQSMVVQYPARSFILKDVKQSNYIVQIISYSNRGIYSSPIESQINIRKSLSSIERVIGFEPVSFRFHIDARLQRFQSSLGLAAQHSHPPVGCIRMRLLGLLIQVLLPSTVVLHRSRMQ